MVSGLTVCGNDDRIGAMNKRVKHNESFQVYTYTWLALSPVTNNAFIFHTQLGSLTVNCLETPCHTSGHICYYVNSEDKTDKVVFTGKDESSTHKQLNEVLVQSFYRWYTICWRLWKVLWGYPGADVPRTVWSARLVTRGHGMVWTVLNYYCLVCLFVVVVVVVVVLPSPTASVLWSWVHSEQPPLCPARGTRQRCSQREDGMGNGMMLG